MASILFFNSALPSTCPVKFPPLTTAPFSLLIPSSNHFSARKIKSISYYSINAYFPLKGPTYLNLQLKGAGLFKYLWPFGGLCYLSINHSKRLFCNSSLGTDLHCNVSAISPDWKFPTRKVQIFNLQTSFLGDVGAGWQSDLFYV